jgi:hypothetical protein
MTMTIEFGIHDVDKVLRYMKIEPSSISEEDKQQILLNSMPQVEFVARQIMTDMAFRKLLFYGSMSDSIYDVEQPILS